MKNLLSEELERYRTLSNYNTKLTLTENTILSEQPGTSLAALEAVLKGGAKGWQRLQSKLKFKSTPQEIEVFLRQGEKDFNITMKNAIKNDINKGGHTTIGYTGPTVKELSKIEVLRKIADDQPQNASQVNKIINEIKLKNDDAYAAAIANPKINKQAGATTGGAGGATNKQKATNLGNTPTGKSLIAKIKAGMPWKTLLKVGAGVATVGVLWWLFTSNSDDPQPPQPPEPPQPPPLPPPRPDSKYKTCPDTFPIAMYCKNETVRKVQGCLSIKTDGAFGPGTQTALVAKGLPGNEITQNTVDVACGSKVVEPVVDPNVDLIDGEDPMNI